MYIPDDVKKILETLEACGHETYVVGGCVRNFLLGFEVNDYDIATAAMPEEVKKVFPDLHVIDTGAKHGTVSMFMNGDTYEITTFRREGEYSDHRHPDEVEFIKDINEDLARRDFTFDAIAYSHIRGYVDPFDGREDITRRTIRAVNNADEKFAEDPLRIIRALRLSACYDSLIEKETADSIKKNYRLTEFVSRERIYSEFCKFICGDYVGGVLKEFSEAISYILDIPIEMRRSNFDRKSIWDWIADSIEKVPNRLELRIAAFLRACSGNYKGKNNVLKAENVLLGLKADKKTMSMVLRLIDALPLVKIEGEVEAKQFLRENGDIRKGLMILEKSAPHIMKNYSAAELKHLGVLINKIKRSGECYSKEDLKINGIDLVKLGVKNALIGDVLDEVLNRVINKKVENKKSALLDCAMEIYSKKASLL